MAAQPLEKSKPAAFWPISFGIVLITEVVLHLIPAVAHLTHYTKPMLMPLLITWVFVSQKSKAYPTPKNKKLYLLLIIGLFFGWAGDIILMFSHPMSFPAGIAAFLTNHIFYILLFTGLAQNTPIRALPVAVIALYVIAFCAMLWPSLGMLKIPVIIYGVVIGTMLLVALSLKKLPKPACKIKIVTGAALFVLSDSILALHRFGFTVKFADSIIMLTYGLAQFMIVKGVLEGLASSDEHAIATPVE